MAPSPHYRPTISKNAPPQTGLGWLPHSVPRGWRVPHTEPVSFRFHGAVLLPLSIDGIARLTGGVDCSGGVAAALVLPRRGGIEASTHE